MSAVRFTDLVDWVEDRLTPERAEEVRRVVANDAGAAESVAWIRELIADAALMRLHEPPPELSTRLHALFDDYHRAPGDGEWRDATLLHDSRHSAVAGLRSGVTADALHLAYDSPAGRLVMEVQAVAPGLVDVQGLIRRPAASDDGGCDLAFLEQGDLRRVTRADAEGRFEVRDVPDTVDELWVTAAEGRVRVSLDLRWS